MQEVLVFGAFLVKKMHVMIVFLGWRWFITYLIKPGDGEVEVGHDEGDREAEAEAIRDDDDEEGAFVTGASSLRKASKSPFSLHHNAILSI